MNDKDVEGLKKKSLVHLECSKDTKNNITNVEIDKMAREIKMLATKKNIVVFVLEI